MLPRFLNKTMKTALERIHEAYKFNDLEKAKQIHEQINKKERQKEDNVKRYNRK